MTALDAGDLEDWVLANAPQFVRGLHKADQDLASGRTISLEDFLAQQRPVTSRTRRKAGARRATRKT